MAQPNLFSADKSLPSSCLSSLAALMFFLPVYLRSMSSSEHKLLHPLHMRNEEGSARGD